MFRDGPTDPEISLSNPLSEPPTNPYEAYDEAYFREGRDMIRNSALLTPGAAPNADDFFADYQ